jgi:hypothetical protein
MIPTARVFPIPYFTFKGSLIDPRLRATFSPAYPLARRNVPLTRTSTFLSCAFREQEDGQATLPIFSSLLKDFSILT